MSIQKLFIANRGEIALRVIRTAQRLGLETVLGVSEADLTSLPAQEADNVVLLGPAPSPQSYLNVDKVVAAAKESGADAVHPGYGFLSENSTFARKVIENGMKFVGPLPEHLDAMGDKLKARHVAIDAGLPVVPGGEADTAEEAAVVAETTGYPLLIKAVSGGGGRGMKRVDDPAQLSGQIDLAMAEAEAAFGDRRIYVERYIGRGRHVEVQILGGGEKAVHLGTRDCSIQRRFQKLVEEAPAPNIPDDKRAAIENAAVRISEYLGYLGAGTVEFLVDADTYDFYFLEMNARIQVEHPVTEEITGLDLIEQQLLIAAGAPWVLLQENVEFDGHAIEVRINAEDPDADFRPSPGIVTRAAWPAGAGVRVDSHIRSGGVVPPNYDSLIGKLIVHGADRDEAIARTARALAALNIEGVNTTAPLHARIMADKRFANARIDTRFFEEMDNG
ncbi:acetyl-CoA carboxylase biotin carboxylase subunit [Emcibacter nanhaiensis]|uniref:biotin carboxylase n=1 Tax=Emcibacter nanhaiensis TaxID=1505037 RepID=A0A501PAI1_9PROT|nr:biotin carboxylase N-terminal domain-containing protein [Emcibacter nanhaiensis]TPD57370.1 ATP-grasp domain-containing protein [Emcibacter nanhaiensis]